MDPTGPLSQGWAARGQRDPAGWHGKRWQQMICRGLTGNHGWRAGADAHKLQMSPLQTRVTTQCLASRIAAINVVSLAAAQPRLHNVGVPQGGHQSTLLQGWQQSSAGKARWALARSSDGEAGRVCRVFPPN